MSTIDFAIGRPQPQREYYYHYCGPDQIRGILQDGLIRASPTPLYRDLAFRDLIRYTEPVVWLTINPIMEMTTLVKVSLTKEAEGLAGSIYRVVIPYGYAGDIGLGEYTEAKKIPHADWKWNIRTGEMAGSNYTTWRLVEHDIPGSDWLRVERLAGMSDSGYLWEEFHGFP